MAAAQLARAIEVQLRHRCARAGRRERRLAARELRVGEGRVEAREQAPGLDLLAPPDTHLGEHLGERRAHLDQRALDGPGEAKRAVLAAAGRGDEAEGEKETRGHGSGQRIVCAGGRRGARAEEGSMASEVRTETGERGFATYVTAAGHAFKADEPLAAGGTDSGPGPYDLLLAALGACTGMTLRLYADRKGWPLERIEVKLRHDRIHAEDCADCETRVGRVDRIEREIALHGPLADAQRAQLLEIADKCPVHRTLTSEIRIETRLAAA